MSAVRQQLLYPISAKGHHTCPPWSISGMAGAALWLVAWLLVSVQRFDASQTNVLWTAGESRQVSANNPCTKALELGWVAGEMPKMQCVS